MSNTRQPRKPDDGELRQLTQFTARRYGFHSDPIESEKEVRALVDMAYIAVFEHYTTGGPGFSGKIMLVLWDGSPGQYEAYTLENNRLQLQDKE